MFWRSKRKDQDELIRKNKERSDSLRKELDQVHERLEKAVLDLRKDKEVSG